MSLPQPLATQTLGHVNLHYLRPEDGEPAARLLEILGLVRTQALDLGEGGVFYRFTTNVAEPSRGDGIIYLGLMPEPLRRLTAAVRERLGVGTVEEHPAVAAARAGQAQDPEQNFHVGFLVSSLEAVEDRMARLKALVERDEVFRGRIRLLANRPPRGEPGVDARLDASPLYGDVERQTYGRNGVQAFVETDLVVAGALADGIVFEMDYIFPGYDDHILSITELSLGA
jgi:hypothetical protein